MFRASLFVIIYSLCDHVAGVAELVDALDLGSSGLPVKVRVLSPAPQSQIVVSKGAPTPMSMSGVF